MGGQDATERRERELFKRIKDELKRKLSGSDSKKQDKSDDETPSSQLKS